jgi:abortive infection bacteriophage resistance protein
MFLFEKVNELFRQKRADQTVDFQKEIQQENQKIKIGNFDMNNIPIGIKLGIFLIVIIVLFGGVFYFLKKMEKKPKDKKKNKKKKTE